MYDQLVSAGYVVPVPEKEPPTVPMDYKWAQELGLIRKPASFMSSICDERGEELLYAGMPISDVFKENIGIGGVLSLLWFQRRWGYGVWLVFSGYTLLCEGGLIIFYCNPRQLMRKLAVENNVCIMYVCMYVRFM